MPNTDGFKITKKLTHRCNQFHGLSSYELEGEITFIIDNDEAQLSIKVNFCPMCGYQSERSKREDHESGCGTLNIDDKSVREVQ